MTTLQMGITMAMCTAATMLTRFLPFLIFSSKDQQPPEVVRYLGRVLPAADGRRRQNVQRGQHNAHRGQHRRDALVRHCRAGFQAVSHENQRRNQYQQFRLDVVHVVDVHSLTPFSKS